MQTFWYDEPIRVYSAPMLLLLVTIMSAATKTYDNLVALRQEKVKRMLGYSSIVHVGYVLMDFVLLSDSGFRAP